jgi:Tfp pilus assembly protein PilO
MATIKSPHVLLDKLKGKEFILGIAGFAVLFFIMVQVVFSTLRAKGAKLDASIKMEEALLKESRCLAAKKNMVMSDLEKYKQYWPCVGSTQEGMTSSLKEIERITQDIGVTILNLAPKQELSRENDFCKIQIDLQIEGDPEQILLFLKKVQESKQLITINSVSLAPKSEDGRILKLDSSISVFLYDAA